VSKGFILEPAQQDRVSWLRATNQSSESNMSEGTDSFISSMELWGAGKIIGRECSQVNLDFCLCKKFKGDEPKECADLAKQVTACTSKV
jgi:hypothetical protein